MKAMFSAMAFTTVLGFSGLAVAADVDHYEGKSVENLEQALAYFKVYNEEFANILEGDLTPEAMNRIHQMSYTMENALGRINAEMDGLAETLEKVHLASESADPDTVAREGKVYLKTSAQIVGGEGQ